MRKKRYEGHLITAVAPGSIGEALQLEAGDRLLRINREKIEDVFDYDFLVREEQVLLLVRKADGEEWELEVEKESDDDLGLTFEKSLMSDYKSCSNRCIFCFIDQMPPGMRETLYFKDDDTRLSFLQGNYVTLTNMSESDIRRMIRYRLAPINISVHTTNPELRCKMLQNRFAGQLKEKMDLLYEAGMEMNGQIVLCKGINDGAELERTISDLSRYLPVMKSLSVVPVGLTKYREGLFALEPFEREDARNALSLIHTWQKLLLEKYGTRFVYASDEFYIKSGEPIPPEEAYEDYPQLENGVGMVRLLLEEARTALEHLEGDDRERTVSVATGKLAAPFLREISGWISSRFPRVCVRIYEIRNDFFGEQITVSGLICGQDLIRQLEGKPLGEQLLLPVNMLRSGEQVFLDDITTFEAEKALQVPIRIVKSSGQDFIDGILGIEAGEEAREQTSAPYELPEL